MHYGTIIRLHVRPEMVDQFLTYGTDMAAKLRFGLVAGLLYQSTHDPYEYHLVIVAPGEMIFQQAVKLIQMHPEYRRVVKLFLDAEPEFADGQVVYSLFPQTTRQS